MSKPSHLAKKGLRIALRWLRATTTAMGHGRSGGKASDAILRPQEQNSPDHFRHRQRNAL